MNGGLYYFVVSASIVSPSSVLRVYIDIFIYIFFSTKGCNRPSFFPSHKSFPRRLVYNSAETISSIHLLSLVLPFVFHLRCIFDELIVSLDSSFSVPVLTLSSRSSCRTCPLVWFSFCQSENLYRFALTHTLTPSLLFFLCANNSLVRHNQQRIVNK